MLQQLGLGIFIVVLLDASIIRIYLVPSIMTHMKRLNWWAPGRLRRVPVRPEDRLIPSIPLRSKLAVSLETITLLLLVGGLYLDYTANSLVQSLLSRVVQTTLNTINEWGGLMVLVVSLLAASFLLLDELTGATKPSGIIPPGPPSTNIESPSSSAASLVKPPTAQDEKPRVLS